MALTYRSVKGSALTSAEADANISTLKAEIDAFVSAPGLGIASIQVVGNQLFVHLTDASVQGPFPLPAATFTWRDAWVAGTSYDPFDIFTVPDDGVTLNPGVYLVLLPYSAPTDFDPNVTSTDGPLLAFMFGTLPIPKTPITHVPTGNHSVTTADAGTYIRMENSATEGLASVIFDADSGVVGDVVIIRRTDGLVDIVGTTNVFLSYPVDRDPSLRAAGSTVKATCTAIGQWDLDGDLTHTTGA